MSNNTSTSIPIAIPYISLGVFGVIENAITAYLMATDAQMKNPTFFYMINLCVADGLILVPLVLFSGLILIWPVLAHPYAMRLASFTIATVWYVQCFLLILTCLSRYVQLEMTHKVQVYFCKRNLYISMGLAWLVPVIIFSGLFYLPEKFVDFFWDLYTWEFIRETYVGGIFFVENLCFDVVIAVLINAVNFLSLMSIRRRRKQVQQNVDTSGNYKREIKLFVQCAVTGCIFTTACAFFIVMSFVEDKTYWYEYLITQILWAVHHIQNPIIYFCLNTRLRKRFFDMIRGMDTSVSA